MMKYQDSYKNKAKKGKKRQKKDPRKGRGAPTFITILPLILACLIFYNKVLVRGEDLLNTLIQVAIIIVVLNVLIEIGWKIYYTQVLLGADIKKLDAMTGEEFELYLAAQYKKHGFKVQTTPKTCDFGADLLLVDPKTNLKICIQAKRYRGLVGEEAVQQTISGKNYYDCDKAMIITNSHYTDAAKKLAKKCDIAMIDRFTLGTSKMYTFKGEENT
jgi:restriction system protein